MEPSAPNGHKRYDSTTPAELADGTLVRSRRGNRLATLQHSQANEPALMIEVACIQRRR